jgi:hypothetical protein
MAVRNFTTIDMYGGQQNVPKGVHIVHWPGLLNGDTGQPYSCPHFSGRAVQVVSGTAGVGLSVAVEGTLVPDGQVTVSPVFKALKDPSSTVIALTAIGNISQVLEDVYQIRPNVTAGDGTTNVDVYLLVTTVR